MALRPEEILQIKYALGVSVTLLGAEPYIGYLAIFDKAIQPYIIDPSTTSATAVTASSAGAQVLLTVAAIPNIVSPVTPSVPAFTVGSSVVVDVGPNAETSQILFISGLTVLVTLVNAHGAGGAYPIVMAGGEAVVRNILTRIAAIETQMTLFAPQAAGVKKVDEMEFFGGPSRGRSAGDMASVLVAQREIARNDLGEAVGFPNLRTTRRAGGSRLEVY